MYKRLLVPLAFILVAASCQNQIRTAERLLEIAPNGYHALITAASQHPDYFTAAQRATARTIQKAFPPAYDALDQAVGIARAKQAKGETYSLDQETASLQAIVNDINLLLPVINAKRTPNPVTISPK